MVNIKATKFTPKVIIDKEKQLFELEGESRPENVFDFYYPIINELTALLQNISENIDNNNSQEPFKANFKLYYFNSSSAKFIADILTLFRKYTDLGMDIKIYWYFNEEDEDIKEAGEELSDMISFQFNYVMIK